MTLQEAASLELGTALSVNVVAAIFVLVGALTNLAAASLGKRPSAPAIAISFGVSSGMLLALSMAVLFGNSVSEFADSMISDTSSKDDNHVKGASWLAATSAFGVGATLVYIIHWIAANRQRSANTTTEADDSSSGDYEAMKTQSNDKTVVEDGEKSVQGSTTFDMMIRLGCQNVPLGIATFVGASEHVYIGSAVATVVAVANLIHGFNVFCSPVTSPSRPALNIIVAALAQHIGGWLALAAMGMNADNRTQGILYGIAAGMVVTTAINTVLPTAWELAGLRPHRVLNGLVAGIVIADAVLVAFKYVGV